MLGTNRPRSGGGVKHNLLLTWGMSNISRLGSDAVRKTMRRMSRKTIPEIKEWLKEEKAKEVN